MAPQMEHAAALDGVTQQGSRQIRPFARPAMSNEPPEVVEGRAFYCVPDKCKETVRISLNRGRHQHESRLLPREIERTQFDAAQTEVARLSDHYQVTTRILALRRTKHQARQAGVIFEPGFGTGDFLPRLVLRRASENGMVKRMCANLESAAQLSDRGRRHGPVLCCRRDVERTVHAIFREQLSY